MLFEVKPKNRYFEVSARGREGVVVFPTYVPGSYVIRELERNVVEIDGIRISKNRFYVKDNFRYLLYAVSKDQREAISTTDYIFINPPAVFPFREINEEYCVKLILPSDWIISTSLEKKGEIYCANNYDEFADSPIEASPYLKILKIDETHIISTIDDVDVEMLKKIVDEADKIIGVKESYVFHFRRSDKGFGGIEHINSSAVVASWDNEKLAGVFAHEYFHRLNVKRIVPADLKHNYEKEVYTSLLWFAEGFTDYMAVIISLRAGVIDKKDALKYVANSLSKLTFPGAKRVSLAESSFTTWIKYYKQDENFLNSSISYYDGGLALALYVDLEMTKKGKRIDDVFKEIYQNRRIYSFYDINEILKKSGVDIEDLVYTPAVSILDRLKDEIHVEFVDKGKPYYGIMLKDRTIAYVEDNSPADLAGLIPGDQIIGFNGKQKLEVKDLTKLTVLREGRVKELFIRTLPSPGHKIKVKIGKLEFENEDGISDVEVV
ncbi:PDZ domain-containing protein [Acidianus sp. HS-5]|uniref:M61 family metallopeptidase n=1 Tax=Acidianus sp. HS-5 TaxID=2886040 RepID=UPI001F47129D|nr:PDZ domain-containing protein [Acidianus sp. HS-5]BDC18480.1 peptidase M61 [Acidianus sp. HS-5]